MYNKVNIQNQHTTGWLRSKSNNLLLEIFIDGRVKIALVIEFNCFSGQEVGLIELLVAINSDIV